MLTGCVVHAGWPLIHEVNAVMGRGFAAHGVRGMREAHTGAGPLRVAMTRSPIALPPYRPEPFPSRGGQLGLGFGRQSTAHLGHHAGFGQGGDHAFARQFAGVPGRTAAVRREHRATNFRQDGGGKQHADLGVAVERGGEGEVDADGHWGDDAGDTSDCHTRTCPGGVRFPVPPRP